MAKGRKTSVRGVMALGNNRFRVRARWTDPRTRKVQERDRLIENVTFQEAVLEKHRLGEELRRGPRDEGVPTLRDFATSWLRGKWPTLSEGSRRRYTVALDDHIFPFLGDFVVSEIREGDTVRWRDERKAKPLASSTVNGHLRILKALMAKASRQYGFPNPTAEVPLLPQSDTRITQEEPNALTEEEVKKFLAAASELFPQHYPMILVLLTTTMRMSAVAALRWDDVDWEKGVILVRRRRDGRDLVEGVKGHGRQGCLRVPLHPEVGMVLRAHKEHLSEVQMSSGLVFPSLTGGLRARSVLDKPFRAALAAAGISKRFTPHGLRRTGNDLYRREAGEVVTMSITGHRTRVMHEHYSTVLDREKQDAVRRAFADVVRDTNGGLDGGRNC